MSTESKDRLQLSRQGVSMIDREPPKARQNGAHEPNGNLGLSCELLHTGRPPSSDILALCWAEPYGESRFT
jgi:hypothetical protein